MPKKVKILSGVTVPETRHKWPWRKLKVGESFLAKGKTHSQLTNVLAYARAVTGHTFELRKVEGGILFKRLK